VRQYVYAAAAVSPLDGRLCSLVLPGMDAEMMGVFLRQTAKAFAPDRCVLFLDQAGWHVAEDLRLPRGMKLVFLPARRAPNSTQPKACGGTSSANTASARARGSRCRPSRRVYAPPFMPWISSQNWSNPCAVTAGSKLSL
jgi:hypothetical protein